MGAAEQVRARASDRLTLLKLEATLPAKPLPTEDAAGATEKKA